MQYPEFEIRISYEMDCCSPDAYNQIFDSKRARKQMDRYRQKGAQKSSKHLVSILQTLPLKGRSVLDIGGGIGTMTFESLDLGASNVQMVEQSRHYLKEFEDEVMRRKLDPLVTQYYGDFVQISDGIKSADLVVLDKVICCYPVYQIQITRALAKTKKWIVYSIPADRWWIRWSNYLGNEWRKLRGADFRTYVHSTALIESLVSENGFSKSIDFDKGVWQYVLFERVL